MSLSTSTNLTVLTPGNYDSFIENNEIVLVYFWADWCGPCKMVNPILEKLQTEYKDKVTIGIVDVDKYQDLAMKYGASSIPTFWIYKEGISVGRVIGAQPREAFVSAFNEVIKLDMEEVRARV